MGEGLKTLLEIIGIDKIPNYVKDLFVFYFKPLSFFDSFFRKPFKDKFKQTLFYVLIVIILFYVLSENLSLKEVVKNTFIEISVVFFSFLIIYASNFTYNKIRGYKFSSENLIFFLILAKILIVPFQIVFYSLFINYENYNYYFMKNLFLLFTFLYVFLFSSRVFYKKIMDIIFIILLNVLFFNISIWGCSKISIDTYSSLKDVSIFEDPIYIERQEGIAKINDLYKIPQYRIIIRKDTTVFDSYFIYSNIFDSVSKGSELENSKYLRLLPTKIKLVDSLVTKCTFERNKIFFRKISVLYRNIDSLSKLRKIVYYSKKVDKQTYYLRTNKDSVIVGERLFIPMPDMLMKEGTDIYKDYYTLVTMSSFCDKPIDLIAYLTPIVYYISDTNSVSR